MWMECIIALLVIYLLSTIAVTYMVHRIPRRGVVDPPDWGRITDTTIPAIDGGTLELWRIEPDAQPSRGVVVLAHGWGRNRDRMVFRARILGRLGWTTVVHSARDHGNSSPKKLVNANVFAQDIQSVIDWVGQSVVLYGHSAGAAGAAIAASRMPEKIDALILEGCYAHTKEALRHLYWWAHPLFGFLFARMILFWMDLLHGGRIHHFDPYALAPRLTMPVLLIHGGQDKRFPPALAQKLQAAFHPRTDVRLFVAPHAGHSDSSHDPAYPDVLADFLDRVVLPGSAPATND